MKDSSSNSGRGEIKRLTADILRKYHQGKLSTRDMHLVEKMLLDDPFAAEALEGMELLDDASGFESIESELNTQLTRHSKREKAKIIPIYQRPWNIAAAIALLLAASLFLFNLPNLLNPSTSGSKGPVALEKSKMPETPEDGKDQNIEKKEENTSLKTEDTIISQDKSAPETGSEEGQELESKSTQGEQIVSNPIKPVENENIPLAYGKAEETAIAGGIDATIGADKIDNQEQLIESGLSEDENIREKEISKVKATEPDQITYSETPQKKSKSSFEHIATRSNVRHGIQKTISGQVTSAEDGRGLPGVNLFIKGTNKGVVTDADGNYHLSLENNESIIVYNFIGYETEEVMVKEQEIVDVELEPNLMALEEIVVVNSGEPEVDEFLQVINAQPEVGNSGYKRYLQENLRYPPTALKDRIEGKVKVTFFVQPNGQLSDFKIRRGVGYGCDEEAIRLIREGPDWQPAMKGETPIKQKVRVKVRFKIEK